MSESLEDRVTALERALAGLTRAPGENAEVESAADDQFWLLSELRRRNPVDAVVFGGTATVGGGEVAWQWGLPSDQIREQDWEPAAGVLDALSHPVRLRLVQRVLNGTATTAELGEDVALGTTGQLYHHLRALVAAGWLQSVGRGRWGVPAVRVIPLLVVVMAATSR
jgi:hypothetical protein